jgi:hypothetical protein
MPEFSGDIYSPRWGHTDTYTFTFEPDHMLISMSPREARCNWVEGRDPVWDGESIEHILRNDSIYPPSILPALFEHLWKSWRNGEVDESAVAAELAEVIKWINVVTEAKPDTDFWNKYF